MENFDFLNPDYNSVFEWRRAKEYLEDKPVHLPNDQNQEIELLRFQSKPAALKFLESITKNPDVAGAKLL